MPLHPQYVCSCAIPSPLIVPSPVTQAREDSGLCGSCDMVYDESLYERRLRQYLPGYGHESLHDFLLATDPHYQALVASQPA